MDKLLNEFRQDLVSGDWVLFSAGREHSIRKFESFYQPREGCPFEDLKTSGQEIVWSWPDEDSREITIIKNKYPAVTSGLCGPDRQIGPFKTHDATGEHNVIIYKDHEKHFSDFSIEQAVSVIRVYKKRYQEMAKASDCVEYVMIFHNYGREAGASIYHPHSQIISLPILPPDVSRSLFGSFRYYQENKKKVYDLILEWELKQKKRIVYENDMFVVFCPFVSKFPYEIRIFPRDSHAHFEKMPDEFDKYLAEALLAVLAKIKKILGNPSYNFFIHTAPVHPVKSARGGARPVKSSEEFNRGKQFNGVKENAPSHSYMSGGDKLENFHEFYSWHIEILPKFSILAGFELGTGIDINVVDPDVAAEKLRNV